MRRASKLIIMVPTVFLGLALFIFIGGTIVMLLWNWLLPTLFGLPRITFWQALGLLALCRILFGGVGRHGGGRGFDRSRLRRRMAERWEQMTPEERERFRHSIRGRWCGMPAVPGEEGKVE